MTPSLYNPDTNQGIIETKFISGNYKYPVKMNMVGKRIEFEFRYNKEIMAEIKAMKGHKWHGFEETNPRKIWSVENCLRNWFQIHYLMGMNPYAKYDGEWVPFSFASGRQLYVHQQNMTRHGLTVHYGIWAAEMGTGKTLAAIELMEQSGKLNWWWIGPKSALRAVELEFRKWKSKVIPRTMTYENLVKIAKAGDITPDGVIFDESSRIKTPTAQRSQAALHLADSIREEKEEEGYVILMSGSPAPKSPLDWWHQAEVACPGFLKEGDINKFKNRLGIVTTETSVAGGKFARIVSWKDNDKKCAVCGLPESDECHDKTKIVNANGDLYHAFEKTFNEVDHLYKRLKGLTYIVFKKDCLDLPQRVHKIIHCKPNLDTVKAARLIALTAKSAIQVLTLTRELSDGFQYKTVRDAVPCPCGGIDKLKVRTGDSDSIETQWGPVDEQVCPQCHGSGNIVAEERQIVEVPCPKDDALLDLLEDHDEYRRLIVYAGFTASIDRVTQLVRRNGWEPIRVDGRGWYTTLDGGKLNPTDMLERFQNLDDETRMVFVGHPGSAGMGLTLTASPSIVYYSNDFNAESRIQSMARIDRPGSRGNNIFDLVHLPTDQLVLNNLDKKLDLQAMTLGDIRVALNSEGEREV